MNLITRLLELGLENNNISINSKSSNNYKSITLIFIASLILFISSSSRRIILINTGLANININSFKSIIAELSKKNTRGILTLILIWRIINSSIRSLISRNRKSKYG